jgi:hypothetical protein
MPANPTQAGRNVNSVSEQFADYFMSAKGQRPWQLKKSEIKLFNISTALKYIIYA